MAYLPTYQNKYGQGTGGSEFNYNEYKAGWRKHCHYQDYCAENAFSYVDGMGGGVFDFYDESWGPRLDARPVAVTVQLTLQ
ncbi:MAG: hypothetical protein MZV63_68430 [Marinilabiliales bacterium]|nr:hypothetical protein [Marinilabiliales bacterium]